MCNCVEGNAWKFTLVVSLIASVRVGCSGNLRKMHGTSAFPALSDKTVSLIPGLHRLLFFCLGAIYPKKEEQWSGGEAQSKIEVKQL